MIGQLTDGKLNTYNLYCYIMNSQFLNYTPLLSSQDQALKKRDGWCIRMKNCYLASILKKVLFVSGGAYMIIWKWPVHNRFDRISVHGDAMFQKTNQSNFEED